MILTVKCTGIYDSDSNTAERGGDSDNDTYSEYSDGHGFSVRHSYVYRVLTDPYRLVHYGEIQHQGTALMIHNGLTNNILELFS